MKLTLRTDYGLGQPIEEPPAQNTYPYNGAYPNNNIPTGDPVGNVARQAGIVIGTLILIYLLYRFIKWLLRAGYVQKIYFKLFNNMNNKQKTILKVTVPAIIIIAALGIASAVGHCSAPKGMSCSNITDWARTWWVWVMALLAIGGFEYQMFKD